MYGNPVVKTIPLVYYGKFGADPVLQSVAEKNNADLKDLWVKLRGKLIYNRGVVLMELSEKEKSILEVTPVSPKQKKDIPDPVIAELDTVALKGEIIDPKCYFGVMKPGQGKPHNDCAIRCISGGIQPLLVVRNGKGEETFFALRGINGEPIHKQVLHCVGQPVEVKGTLEKVADWYVMKIDPLTGIKVVNSE
jgi:hypothetical protein